MGNKVTKCPSLSDENVELIREKLNRLRENGVKLMTNISSEEKKNILKTMKDIITNIEYLTSGKITSESWVILRDIEEDLFSLESLNFIEGQKFDPFFMRVRSNFPNEVYIPLLIQNIDQLIANFEKCHP